MKTLSKEIVVIPKKTAVSFHFSLLRIQTVLSFVKLLYLKSAFSIRKLQLPERESSIHLWQDKAHKQNIGHPT